MEICLVVLKKKIFKLSQSVFAVSPLSPHRTCRCPSFEQSRIPFSKACFLRDVNEKDNGKGAIFSMRKAHFILLLSLGIIFIWLKIYPCASIIKLYYARIENKNDKTDHLIKNKTFDQLMKCYVKDVSNELLRFLD